MEELTLTDPVVIPAKTTDKYRVVSLLLDLEAVSVTLQTSGLINIKLKDNNNEMLVHQYTGAEATNMIKVLNTANLTVKSMHKRILEKLSADGVIPGTVTGAPDPPTE